jgi:hypothetical protein
VVNNLWAGQLDPTAVGTQDPTAVAAQGPSVPHPGMTGGVIGLVGIAALWMYVQHKYYEDETSIPRLGLVFILETFVVVWLLERGSRAAQNQWPSALTDWFAI